MRRKILFTALILAAPRAALACPVCFGQSDSPLALAANMGIWAMLAVTLGVLGAFASFFIYLMRRARLFADDDGTYPADRLRQGYGGPPTHHAKAEAGSHVRHVRDVGSDPQEGTAQC